MKEGYSQAPQVVSVAAVSKFPYSAASCNAFFSWYMLTKLNCMDINLSWQSSGTAWEVRQGGGRDTHNNIALSN